MNIERVKAILVAVKARTNTLKGFKADNVMISDVKTFKQAEEVLTTIIDNMVDDEIEVVQVVEETVEEVVVSLREQVKAEVIELLEAEAKTTFKIASLIGEVKDDFDKSDEFLAWCKVELGLGKASVYKYLKIEKVFGEHVSFAGVAMRVLSELASYKHLEKILDDAEGLALDGKLDSKAAMALIDAYELKLNPPKTPPVAPTAPTAPVQGLTDIPEQLEDDEDEDDEPPFDVTQPVSLPPQKVVTEPEQVEPSELDALTKQIEALTEQLAKANETIAEMSKKTTRDTKVASAPELPQFKNACLYARLGLGQVESQDAKKVKKAFRELVKLGYGEGHNAYASIKDAMEQLTK